MNNIRIALALAGFVSALVLPPWVPLVVIVLLALRYRAVEAIFLALFMDLLWLPGGGLLPFPLVTGAALIVVWGLEPLRLELLR